MFVDRAFVEPISVAMSRLGIPCVLGVSVIVVNNRLMLTAVAKIALVVIF